MPSFADSIFLFVLALLLFGPKRLPALAREVGKWMGEFRRASNEFKMQMNEELRISEQADRQKRISEMEAAAPVAPPLDESEHPHLRSNNPKLAEAFTIHGGADAETATAAAAIDVGSREDHLQNGSSGDGVRPIPIATSGDLHMMPPATGLPVGRTRNGDPLGGLIDSIPEATSSTDGPVHAGSAPENAVHGD